MSDKTLKHLNREPLNLGSYRICFLFSLRVWWQEEKISCLFKRQNSIILQIEENFFNKFQQMIYYKTHRINILYLKIKFKVNNLKIREKSRKCKIFKGLSFFIILLILMDMSKIFKKILIRKKVVFKSICLFDSN